MKKQLMTIILAATMIGGTGTSAFAATTNNCPNSVQAVTSTSSGCPNTNTSNAGLDIQKYFALMDGQAIKYLQTILNNKSSCPTSTTNTNVATKTGNTETNTVLASTKPATATTGATTTNTSTTSTTNTTNTTNTTTNAQTSVTSDKFIAAIEQKIFQKVNEERAKAGVGTLTYNTTMEKYARIKSADMGDRNYFDHADPQGNLITAKMKSDGVTYRAWGENIAYIGGVSDIDALANEFMTNWMNSPGHRANILSTNFASMGVGVYKVGNRVYATQEFYK